MSYMLYWPNRKHPGLEIEVEGTPEKYEVLSVTAQKEYLDIVPHILTEDQWDMFIKARLEDARESEIGNELFDLAKDMMLFQREG